MDFMVDHHRRSGLANALADEEDVVGTFFPSDFTDMHSNSNKVDFLPKDSSNVNSSYILKQDNVSSSDESFSVLTEFEQWRKDPELAVAVAAIKALTAVIKRSEATTMMGLEIELITASDTLKERHRTSISLSAGCDLFLRYVTRTSALESEDFATAKVRLIERGERFGDISLKARKTIAALGQDFLKEGCTILTHGCSRVLLTLYKHAAATKKHFNLVLTEGRPDESGLRMASMLSGLGIPVTLVLDCAIGYVMERVDMVLVGADAVVESGGIINTLGTYPLAVMAKVHNKPVYVAAESFKFARMFPLDQRDFVSAPSPVDFGSSLLPSVTIENSKYDYTPPHYLSLLFTDLGILTPSAISDELIQLYL